MVLLQRYYHLIMYCESSVILKYQHVPNLYPVVIISAVSHLYTIFLVVLIPQYAVLKSASNKHLDGYKTDNESGFFLQDILYFFPSTTITFQVNFVYTFQSGH